MEEKKNQYGGMKRPTVQLTPEEHRSISHYCIDKGIKIGDFLKRAAFYCMQHNINLPEDK
jgi:hypothetical protein